MSKKSDPAVVQKPEENKAANRKYPTERLLRSSHLAGYQKDFARVVLTEPFYTISEAKAALDMALKGGK